MDRPSYTPATENPSGATGAGIATQSDKATTDLFGPNAGQSQSAAEQGQVLGDMRQAQHSGLPPQNDFGGNAFGSTAGLTGSLGVQGAETAGDPTFGAGAQSDAADVVMSDSGNITQAPPVDDGVADNVNSDPSEPNAVDAVTYEGKKVFSPHELNQAGEDKEYFHPEKDHKFDAPNDANDHALTPDIEVKPDNTVGRVG